MFQWFGISQIKVPEFKKKFDNIQDGITIGKLNVALGESGQTKK